MDLEKFYDEYWRNVNNTVDHKRLDLIVEHIKSQDNVLEINCGLGKLAEKIIKKGVNLTVTDMSNIALEKAISVGVEKYKAFKIDMDTDDLPFKESEFDVVVSNSMIEHGFFPEKTIIKGSRVLKNGGKFIIMVPNIGHWRFRLWLLFGDFPYIENTPTDTLHLRFFTKKTIIEMGRRNGLVVDKVRGSSGLWVGSIYPFYFRFPVIKDIYEILATIYPSLFARYLLVIFKK